MEAKGVRFHSGGRCVDVTCGNTTGIWPTTAVKSIALYLTHASHAKKKLINNENKCLIHLCSVNRQNEFLPILQNDFLKSRLTDLQEITADSTKLPLTFHYSPIGIGKLRLMLHVEHAMNSLKKFGFSNKDVDEVKGIFSDTNIYLLCGTIFIGSVHVSGFYHILHLPDANNYIIH